MYIGFIALPITLLWMLVTARVDWESALVGFVIGSVAAVVMRKMGIQTPKRLRARQIVAAIRYTGHLAWGGLLSSIQVARLILRRDLDLHTGIVALRADGSAASARLAALSAHGINMSPGQLVVDFADDGTLFVHLIDIDAARPGLEAEQAARLAMLSRILGDDPKATPTDISVEAPHD